MRVDEVTFELGVPRPYAYKLIKKMNEELNQTGKRRGIICNYADAEYFMPVINCVSSEVKIIAVKHSLTGAESLNTSTSRFGVSRSTLQK